MAILISPEQATPALAQELRPLWQKCWDECSVIKGKTCAFHGQRGFAIEPDVEKYLTLAERRALVVVTLRDENVLHGFLLAVLYNSTHHKPAKAVTVDSFYLDQEYRIHVRSFVQKAEATFAARGATIIAWPTTPKGSLYKLLHGLGYEVDDVVLEKQLCALH